MGLALVPLGPRHGFGGGGIGGEARAESNRPIMQYFSRSTWIRREEGDDDPQKAAFIEECLAKRRAAPCA
jgi:hypothetical protein